MNCQRFTDAVGDLARGQMMEDDLRTDALVHVGACEICAERLTNEEALTRALQALSAQLQTQQAPDALEFELRKAFRDPQNRQATSATIAGANTSRRYWLAVAAAVLLLVGTVIAFRMRDTQPAKNEKQLITQGDKPDPKQSPGSETIAVESSKNEPEREVAVKPRRRRPTTAVRKPQNSRAGNVATNHVREVATEFIPLSYSSDVSLQDGGQIVRVELPRSALVKFGLPVNVDRLNEKVKADVWLGVDGLAHAIRFVQ